MQSMSLLPWSLQIKFSIFFFSLAGMGLEGAAMWGFDMTMDPKRGSIWLSWLLS